MTLWLLTSGESGLGSLAMITNFKQQTHGLPAWLQIWISCRHALLQSCLRNSSWPWRWASNQSVLKCSEQYSPLWWSLPLNTDATQRFWRLNSSTSLASLLHVFWHFRDYLIVLRYVGGQTLAPTHALNLGTTPFSSLYTTFVSNLPHSSHHIPF